MNPGFTPYAITVGGTCREHPGMSWYSQTELRCWVCHPEDWNEPAGKTDHTASIVPDPLAEYKPNVHQCQVVTDPRADHPCRRPWDGKHTILGFAICEDCYNAVRQ